VKFRNRFIAVAAILGLGAVNASASLIANLATGLNGSGTLQTTGGSVDANWMYNDSGVSPATGNAKVVDPTSADWFGGWLANGANSSWIAPNPSINNNGPAPYTFTRTFNLSGYLLSSVTLTGGAWAIDDAGTLALNGTTISTVGSGAWGALTSFTLAGATLNQGVNTLTITITSDDQFLEGVRLEGQINGTLSTVPEPATFALFGAGVAALALLRRRRA
jgi:hypothetical protein